MRGRLAIVSRCVAALGLLALLPSTVRAQEASAFRLRTSVGGGLVLSGDQHARLALDLPLAEARVAAGWVAADFLVLEVAASGAALFSSIDSPGALLDVSVGAELGVSVGPARPWVAAHLGAGLTGTLVRPVLRVAIGIDVLASREVAIGPTLSYGHVFQDDGPGFTNDAQFLALALSLTYRPWSEAPAPPEPAAPRARTPRPRRAPPPPPAVELQSEEEIVAMIDEATGTRPRELLVPVLFHFDAVELVACSVGSLHALREHLEEHPELRVLEVEGHADGSGTDAYNDALALRRAEAIRDWLIVHGVAPERLRVAARGEAAPVEGNDAETGRAQNRRVRFRVLMEGP